MILLFTSCETSFQVFHSFLHVSFTFFVHPKLCCSSGKTKQLDFMLECQEGLLEPHLLQNQEAACKFWKLLVPKLDGGEGEFQTE